MIENYWDKMMETDEGAAQYMETYGEGPGCETRKIIGDFINDGETVLDVGCGPGWNLDHFVQFGPEVGDYKGLDYSHRFIKVANQRWLDRLESDEPDNRLPDNVAFPAFEHGDCRKLEEADESWDVVLLQDVLEHTNGYEKPITEALRVAKRRVVITFWRTMRVDDDGDQINDDGDDGYGATYEQKKFVRFLEDLGLHWVETETSPAANRWHRYYVIDKEATHG